MMNLYNEKIDGRPIFHHYPKEGLLNDPNGLIEWKGIFHIFYQLNPKNTTHESKAWGHSTSTDMVHWKREKIALEPVDWFDKNGCYSGSAVVFEDQMYLFYTGNVIDKYGNRQSYQCLATSSNGIDFKKHGPLFDKIEGYTAHVRDPKVWLEEDGTWKMILGAQRLDETGCVLLLSSNNLLDWTFLGELSSIKNNFGYMWECPDLVSYENNSVLIISPQGLEARGMEFQNIYQSGYIVGKLKDGNTFELSRDFDELDRGFEFYAPQTFLDSYNRRILYGWIGAMEIEKEQKFPSIKDGWLHILSIPRELVLVNDKVYQKPVRELQELRLNSITYNNEIKKKIALSSFSQEINITFQTDLQDISIQLCHDIEINWRSQKRVLSVSRTNWVDSKREIRSVQLNSELKTINAYLDISCLELFINDGEEVFSMRTWQKKLKPIIEIIEGTEPIEEIKIFELGYD